MASEPTAVAAETDTGRELESEFEHTPVPLTHRKSLLTVSAVWFGFPMILTNAVPGGLVVAMLGFWQGLAAIVVANLIMFVYVGLLSYRAGETGKSFALQATETFGTRGYAIASGFLSTVVVGWFAFNTGATGASLHKAFGWNETIIVAIAGVLFIGLTYLGITALSWIGAIADYQGVGGGAMTFGVAVTVIMATFADSGTMTADFTRWSKNGRQAVVATSTAFPVASLIAQLTGGVLVAAGAIANAGSAGGDFTPILTGPGNPLLDILVLVFVVVNLGSVCTHCLYNGALGWSHLVGSKMRILTLILGVIGVVVALLGAWSLFVNWLVLLGVLVPPLGAVLIADQVILRKRNAGRAEARVRPSAFVAWAAGAGVALLTHLFVPVLSDAVTGLVVGLAVYLAIELSRGRRTV